MANTRYFTIAYSASTVSSALIKIEEGTEEGTKVTPIIRADECEDYFAELSSFIDVMAEKMNAAELLVHPAEVSESLINSGVSFAYDEINSEHLVIAVQHQLSKLGSVLALTSIW